ncbi:MAG: class I SAM-dependent methyltransferase [Proteobacteria bacterium]|nr:class I SAM-dependent methyltransferase [Pseudomonadota bacterium]
MNPHSCPSCGHSTESCRYRYQNDSSDSFVYHCSNCSLEFLRPLPLAEIDERQMDSIDDAELFNRSLFQTLHAKLIIAPEISRVQKLLGRTDFSMLDVGCGTGWISRIWADAGAQVTGLEPSAARAAIARERGIRVLSCYAEELDDDERYDLIVIRHVVEHLEDPKAILRSFVSRLNPDGLLLVVVPNIDCIGRKIFEADWTWVLPWHCNFFNPCSLTSLLEGSGFQVAKSWQTPSPLWYPESFARKFPRIGAMLKITPLTMLLFAPLVGLGYISGHSDNLTMIAQPGNTVC